MRGNRFLFSFAIAAAAVVSQGQVQPTPTPPVTQSPVSTSQLPQSPITTTLVPLPQGAPNTGQQGPVPKPAQKLPAADKPLKVSPAMPLINGYVANHPLTIDDSMAIALYTNKQLATSLANLQSAEAATGITRAQLNPTLGINSQITYYAQAISFDLGAILPAGTLPAGTSGVFPILPHFDPVNTATFTLPIDITGTIQSAVSQAKFNEIAAKIAVNAARNQIVADVKTAFYNVLRAQAQVGVATDNVNVSLTRLSDANKNYAAGTSPYFDVLSSQRDLADAQQALIVAQGQVSTNLSNLKNTIGLDPSAPLTITDSGAVEYPNGVTPAIHGPLEGPQSSNEMPVPSGNTETPMTAPNAGFTPLKVPDTHLVQDSFTFGPEYQSAVKEALQSRPEILEAQAEVTAAQKGILYAQKSQLPSLSLSLSYVNTPDAVGFTLKNQESATLGISIPIFDGGLAREQVRSAKAHVAAAEINRRVATDQVQVDVQTSYIALVQARNRVAVTNYEVAEARESYRLAQIRYNAGMAAQVSSSPQLEIINAQTSLTQARTDQVNALYDYNNARSQFDRAVGRYSYTGSGPGYPAAPSSSATGKG